VTYYWRMLPGVIGGPALALGLAGCAAGLASARWRAEVVLLLIWIIVLIAGLVTAAGERSRYILLVAPRLSSPYRLASPAPLDISPHSIRRGRSRSWRPDSLWECGRRLILTCRRCRAFAK